MVEFRAVNLNDVVHGMAPILSRTIGEPYDLVLALGDGPWPVRSNASQIEQVLMNLVVNARDAMPQGGQILVESGNLALDLEDAEAHPGVAPGEYATLSVTDGGPGIAKEIREQIFEPFFTTKEVGKGTGLGLATCYGIVKQSRGNITVHSEPGNGTTFRVYLPRLHGEPAIEKTARPERPQTGAETILLVDDEAMVRDVAARMLRSQGYVVLEATNAAEAIQVQEDCDGAIDLLVTDVVMPLTGGKELAKRLQQSRPDIKVLYLSGYAHDVMLDKDVRDRDLALMTKPFSSSELVKKVREVLNSGHS
jgi:CheY-like chemotaxis protein